MLKRLLMNSAVFILFQRLPGPREPRCSPGGRQRRGGGGISTADTDTSFTFRSLHRAAETTAQPESGLAASGN